MQHYVRVHRCASILEAAHFLICLVTLVLWLWVEFMNIREEQPVNSKTANLMHFETICLCSRFSRRGSC